MVTTNDFKNAQNTIQYHLSGSIDPTIEAIEAASGTTYQLLIEGDPKFYLKMDEGRTTNWQNISSIEAYNLGAGSQLIKNVDKNKIELRTIKGSGGVSVSQETSEIIISSIGSNEETFPLTNEQIETKRVILSAIPNDPTKVTLFTIIPCRYGIDYIVEGNILSWAGKTLDGFLDTEDILFVTY